METILVKRLGNTFYILGGIFGKVIGLFFIIYMEAIVIDIGIILWALQEADYCSLTEGNMKVGVKKLGCLIISLKYRINDSQN